MLREKRRIFVILKKKTRVFSSGFDYFCNSFKKWSGLNISSSSLNIAAGWKIEKDTTTRISCERERILGKNILATSVLYRSVEYGILIVM